MGRGGGGGGRDSDDDDEDETVGPYADSGKGSIGLEAIVFDCGAVTEVEGGVDVAGEAAVPNLKWQLKKPHRGKRAERGGQRLSQHQRHG